MTQKSQEDTTRKMVQFELLYTKTESVNIGRKETSKGRSVFYEQSRMLWLLLRMSDMVPDTDWTYSNVVWGMLR